MSYIKKFSFCVSLLFILSAVLDTGTEVFTRQGATLVFANTNPKLDSAVKKELVDTFFKVYPAMKHDFNPQAPDTIYVKVDTSYGGVAYAHDGRVTISSDWLHKKPNDTDVITHEVMHIVQNYPGRSGPGWLTEGIADYVRYKYGVDNAAAGWALPDYSKKSSYTDSYRTTARFLVWLQRHYRDDIVRKLDDIMRSGNYARTVWTDLTGKSLDHLWSEYAINSEKSSQQRKKTNIPGSNPKTIFQTSAPWNAAYDIRSDAALIYGARNNFKQRMRSWKEHGYRVQFMTGIAWGDYQDYFLGKIDGENHLDEGQMERDGDRIMHGENVPYTVPTDAYIDYMNALIEKVIDAGITTLYLEEPEFWARAGYSETFKKKWKEYYGFEWMSQHESPEATYLSSKLKYQLYYDALEEVFNHAKEYGESQGKEIRLFVPTHSLINYSSWQIVSPEASLASLEAMDGYIAQVWTGTSREPVYFDGKAKERVFENAFLEYGSMLSMIKPTGREIYFLTDPIEDWPRTWDDYKRNYQATFTAQLLYPSVDKFEVMPWPRRIYKGKFETEDSDTKQPMPETYATQVQVMINVLNHMPASTNKVTGSQGIGALVSNSMMFQRFPTHDGYEDPQLSNFYGMVMPLLKRGIPVETVHMENLGYPESTQNLEVLIMSYANMKPMRPAVHKHLANWVEQGGVLLYYGRDKDPFQHVREWWNNDGQNNKIPSDDLFSRLGIEETSPRGAYSYGDGKVVITRKDPKELIMQKGGDKAFVDLVKGSYEQYADAGPFITKNSFFLQRGPYDIISVMDESVINNPYRVEGPVIDLFDPKLPVLEEKIVEPGEQALLYNLNRVENSSAPRVLATAARVSNEEVGSDSYTFTAKSPSDTQNTMRILLPQKPQKVSVQDVDSKSLPDATSSWDETSHTLLLQFENSAKGRNIMINW